MTILWTILHNIYLYTYALYIFSYSRSHTSVFLLEWRWASIHLPDHLPLLRPNKNREFILTPFYRFHTFGAENMFYKNTHTQIQFSCKLQYPYMIQYANTYLLSTCLQLFIASSLILQTGLNMYSAIGLTTRLSFIYSFARMHGHC